MASHGSYSAWQGSRNFGHRGPSSFSKCSGQPTALQHERVDDAGSKLRASIPSFHIIPRIPLFHDELHVCVRDEKTSHVHPFSPWTLPWFFPSPILGPPVVWGLEHLGAPGLLLVGGLGRGIPDFGDLESRQKLKSSQQVHGLTPFKVAV